MALFLKIRSFCSAQEMLNYQCHCQVMQQAWLRAICGFCGFFSVCQRMPELTSHGNCWRPEASSVNTSITNLLIYSRNQRKKEETHNDCGPYSHIKFSSWPQERGTVCFICMIQKYNLPWNAGFSNGKYSNFFQGVVSEVVLLMCILCFFPHTYL